MSVFTSGVVLLLNIWGMQNGLSIDPVKEMSEVHKCMQILKACETRYSVDRIFILPSFNVILDGIRPAAYGESWLYFITVCVCCRSSLL